MKLVAKFGPAEILKLLFWAGIFEILAKNLCAIKEQKFANQFLIPMRKCCFSLIYSYMHHTYGMTHKVYGISVLKVLHYIIGIISP